MAVLQKSMSFALMGTLAASCLLLIALWAQEADALPINSQCKLEVSNFQQPYIVNRTFMLAKEVPLHLSFSPDLLGVRVALAIFFEALVNSSGGPFISVGLSLPRFSVSL